MLEDSIEITDGPVAIRWPKTPAPQVKWNEVGSGTDARKVIETPGIKEVCILAAGKMLAEALGVLKQPQGINATIWDPRILHPLDKEMLADAMKHKLVITIEDGYVEGGFGSSVLSHINREQSDCRVINLGVPLSFHSHDKPDSLLSSFGLNEVEIAKTIEQALSEI